MPNNDDDDVTLQVVSKTIFPANLLTDAKHLKLNITITNNNTKT